jgi:hypothetical protein
MSTKRKPAPPPKLRRDRPPTRPAIPPDIQRSLDSLKAFQTALRRNGLIR